MATVVALLGVLAAPAHSATFELFVSASLDRSNPTPLEGSTVAGNSYVFVSPDSGASKVEFWLDDPNRTRAPIKVERNAPWDFAGTAVGGSALPWDTHAVADGMHTITARITPTSGSAQIVHASLSVDNDTADAQPSQIHLAWVDEPSTTMSVVWRTGADPSPSTVEYRATGTSTWNTATGAIQPSGTAGQLHVATLTGLEPATEYEYRVPGDGGETSPVLSTRTAPAPGPADFEAVYVADTGIIGRTDGLTTGTAQVIDEIAALDPLLVLPGGDYAYFNTDKRFANLDAAIDAWFTQMEPVSRRAPMMPVYGNHEALLGENVGSWIDRFPTPPGFDGRRNYSFDVGDVHFVALFAVTETSALPAATVTWLQQDVLAAKAAGARWVIPYFHVSPFSDGENHPSNLALRAQLGPVFEALDIPVVLTSHDQAYERTFPLVDVPATNTPTTSALDCYTPDDGVTWVKTSPGGKLSNKNDSFSEFTTDPAPDYVAVRHNTLHHYTRLRVAAAGTLRVETFGVLGDGTPPVLVDAFEYTTGSCGPAVTVSQSSVAFDGDVGGDALVASVDVTTNEGAAAAITANENAPWLSIAPGSADAPASFALTAEPGSLGAGTYTTAVTFAADGHRSARLTVTLTLEDDGTHALWVSTSNTRSAPAGLDGATVRGIVYAFVAPDAGASRVRFWLDKPTMSGSPRQTENNAPWDFAGGNNNGTAKPFDTRALSEGTHTITAAVTLAAGTTSVLHATFVVDNQSEVPTLLASPSSVSFTTPEGANPAPQTVAVTATGGSASLAAAENAPWLAVELGSATTPGQATFTVDSSSLAAGAYSTTVTFTAVGFQPVNVPVSLTVTPAGGGELYQLLVSTSSTRAAPQPLEGRSVSGNIYVFVAPESGATQVKFWLDDAAMVGSPRQTENTAPFDFAGGAADGSTARKFDTRTLSSGPHTITASIALAGGGTVVIHATFVVVNG